LGNLSQGGLGGVYSHGDPKDGGSGYGGGLYCGTSSTATLINCLFDDNECRGADGRDEDGLDENYRGGDAGDALGGVIYCIGSGSCTVGNCTIVNNTVSAGVGGSGDPDGDDGFEAGAGIYGAAIVTDSIVWSNSPDQISGLAVVTYSDVKGGYSGDHNINADPVFTSGLLGDYYLSQSASGQSVDSPCVDSGSDTAVNLGLDSFTTRTDQTGDLLVVDMGYHYPIHVREFNIADFNEDYIVNAEDLSFLASQYGKSESDLVGDLDTDGDVDLADFELFVENWLEETN
jgi:hypothetical protein